MNLTQQERNKKREDYLKLVMPAVLEAVDVFIDCGEDKYCVGLDLSNPTRDAMKSISHKQKSLRCETNPDGNTHHAAQLARAIKFSLAARLKKWPFT